jgi:hypothetical protein
MGLIGGQFRYQPSTLKVENFLSKSYESKESEPRKPERELPPKGITPSSSSLLFKGQ